MNSNELVSQKTGDLQARDLGNPTSPEHCSPQDVVTNEHASVFADAFGDDEIESPFFDQMMDEGGAMFNRLRATVGKMPAGTQKWTKLIASAMITVYQVVKSPTTELRAAACAAFAINHLDFGSFIEEVMKISTKIRKYVIEYFGVRVESMQSTFAGFRQFCTYVLTSDIVRSFRELIVGIVSRGYLPKDATRHVVALFGKVPKMSLMTILEKCGELVEQVLGVIDAHLEGLPISTALFSSNPVATALNTLEDICAFSDLTYTGLPTPGRMCRRLYVVKLKTAIDTLTPLFEKMGPFDPWRRRCRDALSSANSSYAATSSQLLSGIRDPPFSVLLFGSPGIGKSHILHRICEFHCKVKGRTYTPDLIYTRVKTSQYWEGHLPFSEPFIHYSELGGLPPKLAATQGSQCINEFTSVADGMAYPLDMAFEDKGKYYAIPEVILADANDSFLNIPDVTSNPAAYYRRLLFIEMKVKPEFVQAGCNQLDIDKSLAAGGDLNDRYVFRVFKRNAISHSAYDTVYLDMESNDIYGLEKLLSELFTQHINHNDEKRKRLEESLYGTDEIKDVDGEDEVVMSEALPIPSHELPPDEITVSDVSRVFSDVGALSFQFLSGSILSLFMLSTRDWVGFYQFVFLISFLARSLIGWRSGFFFLFSFVCYAIWCSMQKKVTSVRTFVISRVLAQARHTLELKMRSRTQDLKWFLNWERIKIPNIRFQEHKGKILLLGTSIVVFTKLYFRNSEKVEAESSNFQHQGVESEQVTSLERDVNAGSSYERVKLKNSPLEQWNTVSLPVAPPRTRNGFHNVSHFLGKNVRIASSVTKKSIRTCIYGVCKNLALINRHAFQSIARDQTFGLRIYPAGHDEQTSMTYTLATVNLSDARCVGGDLIMVSLNGVMFKDVREYFAPMRYDQEFKASIGGDMVRASFHGAVHPISESGTLHLPRCYSYQWPAHRKGACGLPLIGDVGGGTYITGIHSAGAESTHASYAILITREEVDSLVDSMSTRVVLSESYPTGLGLPLAKSPFRYEVMHSVEYLGKEVGKVMINKKSGVIATPFAEKFQSVLNYTEFKSKDGRYQYGPPVMRPSGVGDLYVSPYNTYLRKLKRDPVLLDQRLLNVVKDEIVQRVLSAFQGRQLSPLDMQTAVNGAAEDAYLRSMNVNTSAGHGWGVLKSQCLPLDGVSDVPIREAIPELKHKIYDIAESYKRGQSYGFIHKGCLKDEPRSREKIDAGSTRVFYSSPVEFIIFSRMFLAPFYTLMVEKGEVFGTAVGINVYTDTHDVVNSMIRFSDLIMEGDYKAFDVSMPFQIGETANAVVATTLQNMGYNDEAMVMVNSILCDSLHPIVELNRDIFSVPGLQPSGKYATAEDNSLRNLIMLMYAYYSNDSAKLGTFFDVVKPLTYGDDLLAAVKPEVSGFFNNTYYGAFCSNTFGLGYTTAAKGDVTDDFISMTEASFLRRRFVWSTVFDRWIAPIDKLSMVKMSSLFIPSKSVSREIQLRDIARSFYWELFLHVERDEYDSCRLQICEDLVETLQIPMPLALATIPNWDVVRESMNLPVVEDY